MSWMSYETSCVEIYEATWQKFVGEIEPTFEMGEQIQAGLCVKFCISKTRDGPGSIPVRVNFFHIFYKYNIWNKKICDFLFVGVFYQPRVGQSQMIHI